MNHKKIVGIVVAVIGAIIFLSVFAARPAQCEAGPALCWDAG